jgi:hypothetical protein
MVFGVSGFVCEGKPGPGGELRMRWAAMGLALWAALPQGGFTAGRTAREALRPFNVLIGSWQALGMPEGNLEQQRKGTWQETIRWEWQFQDNDAWLRVSFDKGKYFTDGTLRYLPDQEQYQLALTTVDKQTLTFTGPRKEYRLVLERRDEKRKETHRLILSLVQDNRFLYQYEVQPENRPFPRKVYLVGATKEGQPLVAAGEETGPLCVVSYGPPLSPVTYQGQTYYVCCGGCRQEFRASPEKYIKEYEDMRAQRARERAEKNRRP